MAKKEEKVSIATAVALFLQIEADCPTKNQCVQKMLAWVRNLTKKSSLTLQSIRRSLAEWLDNGWITISKEHICVMRSGRSQIKAIADAATSPA